MSGLPKDSPRWISEAEVVSLLDMKGAIAALEAGLREEAAGRARNMPKTHAEWKKNTLHAIGAVFPGAGFVGTKTWAHTEGGATPLLILFDASTGALKAVIEAFALGQLRTGGISGLATKYLAREEAAELAIIGTGKQARTQVAAVHAVRPLKRVRVFSPTKEKRENFARQLKETFGFEVAACSSVEEAVKDAPIVTLVTRATEPFLQAAHLAKGAHVNAVGAIVPSRVEFTQDLFGRCGPLVVDMVDSVRRLSREFMDCLGEDEKKWERVQPLSRIVAAGKGREKGDDLSLFKSMGMGISDLSLGMEIYRLCVEQGLGHSFPHPQRAAIRLG